MLFVTSFESQVEFNHCHKTRSGGKQPENIHVIIYNWLCFYSLFSHNKVPRGDFHQFVDIECTPSNRYTVCALLYLRSDRLYPKKSPFIQWYCSHRMIAAVPLKLLWALQWRHNGHTGVSNHQPHHCLLNRLFRRRSKKTSKIQVAGLCVGNSPVTGQFPAQVASYAENVSIWWRHHEHMRYSSTESTSNAKYHHNRTGHNKSEYIFLGHIE